MHMRWDKLIEITLVVLRVQQRHRRSERGRLGRESNAGQLRQEQDQKRSDGPRSPATAPVLDSTFLDGP